MYQHMLYTLDNITQLMPNKLTCTSTYKWYSLLNQEKRCQNVNLPSVIAVIVAIVVPLSASLATVKGPCWGSLKYGGCGLALITSTKIGCS